MNFHLSQLLDILGASLVFAPHILSMPNECCDSGSSIFDCPLNTFKRGKMEIIVSVLEVALNGARKTHIIYKANLDTRSVKRHLEFLMKIGFIIQLKDNPKIYKTTEKGCAFLNQYKKLQDMLHG